MPPIYFDNNATTRLDAGVREEMLPFLGEVFGNPSSVHQIGRRARALLDDSRDRVARVWKCKPSEVIFTSGGTESVNLALLGSSRMCRDKGRHIISTGVEHHAVLECLEYLGQKEAYEITYLPVDGEGRVSVESLEHALRSDTILVSIMAANNETGILQPVAQLGEMCRRRKVLFHTDAVQWFGKQPFESIHQFNADMVSLCAHKFHGPKGAGALYLRSPFRPDPIILGGGHENETRAGTENLAGIAGLAAALEKFVPTPVFPEVQLREWTSQLAQCAKSIPGVTLRSPERDRLSNTIAFTVQGTDGISLMAGLDLEGICASSGSACSAGSLEPSHVMEAMGVPAAEANALVRFSLGRENTGEEVRRVIEVLPRVVERVRR